MKKIFIILMTIGLIVSITVSPVFARPQHVSHHRVWHHGDWLEFGFGLLTGVVVTNLFYGPPQKQVVVRHAPAAIYYSDPVIMQGPPSINKIPEHPTGEAVVTVGLLNVRSGPGKNYPVTHQIRRGSKLMIHGSSQGWLYVKLPSGEYGWVMQEFTARVQSPASG
jgi:uncharacterized protein YgiM (DUF1202 family)